MVKWLILWKMREQYYSLSKEEHAKASLLLREMTLADLKAGSPWKDWGGKTGSDEGYGLLEGTEAEVNESLVKYSPYVSFEATPVVSMPQLAEAAKKRAVSIKK